MSRENNNKIESRGERTGRLGYTGRHAAETTGRLPREGTGRLGYTARHQASGKTEKSARFEAVKGERSPRAGNTGRAEAVKAEASRVQSAVKPSQTGGQKAAAPEAPAGKAPRIRREKAELSLPRLRDPRRKKIYALAAVAAAVLVALAAVLLGSLPTDSADRYLRQAEALAAEQDYEQALRLLRQAAEKQPSPEIYLRMADCYEALDNLPKALEALRQGDLTDPRVTERIARLEQRRLLQEDDSLLSIGGQAVRADATALSLEGLGLKDEDLQALFPLHALESLSLADNAITDLSALTAFGGLTSLDLRGNRIQDLAPLTALTALRSLNLDNNPIRDLSPLKELKNLVSLSVSGVAMTPEALEDLTAALPGCAIRSELQGKEGVEITLGGLSFSSTVTELDLSGREIYDISVLAACTNLQKLDLHGNQIGDLQALMNLPFLENLNVSDNQLTDLRPLMGLSGLRVLNASGNLLTDTSPLTAMTGLTTLDLSRNPLSDFSGLRKLTALRVLHLEDTGAGDEALPWLYTLSNLGTLALDDNAGITDVAMGQLHSALPACQVSHSELVYQVDLGGWPVESNLTVLDLSARGISDLTGLERMSCLEELDLSRNGLNNLVSFQYSPSRNTLRILDLGANDIDDVTSLSVLTAVQELDLHGNRIDTVAPLLRLDTLHRLDLSGNPLTEEQLAELREALPDCDVIF